MYKPVLIFVCGCLVMVSLSGCFGMISVQPGECEKETPKLQNKAEYLKERGKPKSIEPISGKREIWAYEESIWCGVIPCWGLCVPLVLPVCDGFERVYFKGDRAERVHTRIEVLYGFVLNAFAIMGAGGGDPVLCSPACNRRLSRNGSLDQKIEPGKMVAISIGIDTPKHQQDKEFQKAALRLRDVLAADLVKEDFPVFKAVVAEGQSADYAMEVTLTSATFKSFINRPYEVEMVVRITDNRTNQSLGSFEVYSIADKLPRDDSTRESAVWLAVIDIHSALFRYEESPKSPDIKKPDYINTETPPAKDGTQ